MNSCNHGLALRGMRRASAPSRSRSAFTTSMLAWLVDHLDIRLAQHRVICGAAMLGFFFLMRSSEYLSVRGRHRHYTLQVRDVEVLDVDDKPAVSAALATSVTAQFRGSKTDQAGVGVSRVLKTSGHPVLCPVRAAMLLLHHAKQAGLKPEDPLCSFAPSLLLKAEVMSMLTRAIAAGTGAKDSNFSCHSLRSGSATALLAAGVDSTLVMLHGRWRSDVFHRYTRLTQATGASLATRMTEGAPRPSSTSS